MWYLASTTGQRIYLRLGEELIFGRKIGEIIVQSDTSVSREHACVKVEPKDVVELNRPPSLCRIQDLRSKYGTYVRRGNQKIEVTNDGYLLMEGDVIRLGLQDTIFVLRYIPIVTVISSLSEADKRRLQSVMDFIDGIVTTEWTSSCTHMTVTKATLTEKVTWALAAGLPIVTVDYWVAVKNATNDSEDLPKIDEFIPVIGESLVDKKKHLLCPNAKRKTLFNTLIFVHFSATQYKSYGRMIQLAGGKSLLYSKKPLTSKELCAPNVIVVQCPGSDSTQSSECFMPEYDSIYKMLKIRNRKMISESDIPLAILHCSVEKYCNPKYNFAKLLKRRIPKPDNSEVLVLDTQDENLNLRPLPKVLSKVQPKTKYTLVKSNDKFQIIPETYDNFDDNELAAVSITKISPAHSTPKDYSKSKEVLQSANNAEIKAPKPVARASSVEEVICIPDSCDSSTSCAESLDTQSSSYSSEHTHAENTDRSKETMEIYKEPSQTIDSHKNHKLSQSIKLSTKCNNLLEENSARDNSNTVSKSTDYLKPRNPTVKPKCLDFTLSDDSTDLSISKSEDDIFSESKKRGFPDNSITEDSSSSRQSSSPSVEEIYMQVDNSELLRSTTVGKRFKKAYVPIPQQRIGLSDMYV